MNVAPVYLWGFWVLWLAFVTGHVWFRLLSGLRPICWATGFGVLTVFGLVLAAASGWLIDVPVVKAMLSGLKRGDTEWWLLFLGAGLASLPVGLLVWSDQSTSFGTRWTKVWTRTFPIGLVLGLLGFLGGLLVQTGVDKTIRASLAPNKKASAATTSGFNVQKVAEIGDFSVRLTRTPDNRLLFTFNRTRAGFEDGGVYELAPSADDTFRVNLMAFHPSLHRAYGLAVWRDEILVARAGHSVGAVNGRMLYPPIAAVTRLKDLDGNGYAEFQDDVVTGLPGVNGDSTQHQNNGVCADAEGNLYITSATGGNRRPALQEWEGCILKYNRATGKTEVFAEGFRNPWGVAFNDKGDLFVTDNDIGANPGDELNHVIRGEHYGHPYVVVGEEKAGEGFRHPVWSSEEANLCGLVYVGAKSPLPDRFKNAFFICDMARSVVIRVELAQQGDSYKLVKAETAFSVPTPVDIAQLDNGDFFVTSYYERAVYRISLEAMNLSKSLVRILLAALFAYGGAFVVAGVVGWRSGSSASSTPSATASSGKYDLQRGEFWFRRSCNVCHSLDPKVKDGTGPNLSQIGRDAATRRPGMSATAYIIESIMEPEAFRAPGVQGEMPKNINVGATDEIFRDLVAFLATQGGQLNDRELAKAVIPPNRGAILAERHFTRTEVELGRKTFLGKGGCIACHSFSQDAETALIAPNLFFAGLRDRDAVRDSILHPGSRFAAGYEHLRLNTKNGEAVEGRLVQRTAELLSLVRADELGHLHRIDLPKDRWGTEPPQSYSPMPEGYGDILTKEEIDALVAFIVSLN